MQDLNIGDEIETFDKSGKALVGEVVAFIDRFPWKKEYFLEIQAENGDNLCLTPNHLIYKTPSGCFDFAKVETAFASDLNVGDVIFVRNGQGYMIPTTIVAMKNVTKIGSYSPLLSNGNILVNGIAASCYSEISHGIYHTFAQSFFAYNYLRKLLGLQKENCQLVGHHWIVKMFCGLFDSILPEKIFSLMGPHAGFSLTEIKAISVE